MRPPNYLFPGAIRNWRVDKPITPKVVWLAVRQATQGAGIDKHVTPHTLRHCFARSKYFRQQQGHFHTPTISHWGGRPAGLTVPYRFGCLGQAHRR